MIVAGQQLEQMLSQRFGRQLDRLGQGRQILDRPIEHRDHRAGGVGAAGQHRISQLQEAQQQFQSQNRFSRRNRTDDHLALRLEIGQQSRALARPHERGGAADRRQPLAHLLASGLRPIRRCQGQAKTALHDGAAAAQLDQQRRQHGGTQRFKVGCVERAPTGHGRRGRRARSTPHGDQLSTVNNSWIRLNPSRQTPQRSEMVPAMGSNPENHRSKGLLKELATPDIKRVVGAGPPDSAGMIGSEATGR